MLKKTVKIIEPLGLHTQIISKIVNETSQFISDVSFVSANKVGNAKSLINLVALYIKYNQEIEIRVSGIDEDSAMSSILNFMKENKLID